MISLNLISPLQKKIIKNIIIFQHLKNIAFVLVACAVVASVALFFINQLLQSNQQSINEQIATERSIIEQGKATSLESAIKSLNEQLTLAQKIQDKYIRWTSFFRTFSENVPDGITLATLQMNSTTSSLRITGVASNREVLLTFQDNLKKMSHFSNLVFPISNLAQKEQVTFEITGQLTKALYE